MNRTRTRRIVLAFALCWWASGCNVPPSVPRNPDGGELKALRIAPDDPAELEAVKAAESARANYAYRLEVLQAFYEKTADLTKLTWARKEAENLRKAHRFRWQGIQAIPPKGESLAGVDERNLVEYTVAARRAWTKATEDLVALYTRKGDSFKLEVMQNVQQRFDPVRTYMYFLAAEIPPADLKPVDVIPEADRLYEQALKLYRGGKGWSRVFVSTDYPKQRQALLTFRRLVRDHPRSTKIALSAYYIGEIYKEYFDENVRAVHWYQRAWEWDRYLSKPARFQAATVYDARLQDKQKAVECYRLAIKYDPWRLGNWEYATSRIAELTGTKK